MNVRLAVWQVLLGNMPVEPQVVILYSVTVKGIQQTEILFYIVGFVRTETHRYDTT